MLDVSVQAWFSHDEVALAPGSTLTLPLTVHNLGESTESFTIVPGGLAASWTSVSRGSCWSAARAFTDLRSRQMLRTPRLSGRKTRLSFDVMGVCLRPGSPATTSSHPTPNS